MEVLNGYVTLVVMLICLCVGYILKNVIPSDKINRFIPLIMGCLGVLLNVWVYNWSVSPDIILGGLMSGLASTGSHQLITKIIEG